MAYFKRTLELNDEEKRQVSEMSGKIMLWILNGESIGYMADKLKLHPSQVECNIDEMLYVLRRQVGKRRYLKMLFQK